METFFSPDADSDFGLVPDVMNAQCPSRRILGHATSRWGVLVLIALLREERLRFGELRRRISGVSERMLSQTLQTLEADGMLLRKAFAVVPPHVEYTLTPSGREVALKVADLARWIEANLGKFVTGAAQ